MHEYCMQIQSRYRMIALAFLLAACKEDTIAPVGYGSIAGVVTDAETGERISNVSISTSPPTTALVSDAAGTFRIDNVAAGNYTIALQKTGYTKSTVNVAVVEDQTTSTTILLQKITATHTPPNPPMNPSPPHQVTNQPVALTLSWSVQRTGAGDTLRFDVYLYESSSPTARKVAANIRDTSFAVDSLKYGTTYFWQVVVKDTANFVTNGVIWTFSTQPFPDNRIVYASASGGTYDIYSADSVGANVVRLTSGASREWWPRLSPGRTRIAFSSDALAQPFLYIMNRDGTNPVRITPLAATGYNNYGVGFCFSPDGAYVLYARYDKLYRVDVGGTNVVHIATAPPNRHFRDCDWTGVGNRIVALTIGQNPFDGEIYTMNADGSNMTVFVENLPGTIENPSFSTDGRSIMFTRDVSGFESPDGRQLDAHILIVRMDRTDSADVSVHKPNGTNDTNPRFSPDGSRIIFTNTVNDGLSPKDVWIMNIDGTNRRRIIANAEMADWR